MEQEISSFFSGRFYSKPAPYLHFMNNNALSGQVLGLPLKTEPSVKGIAATGFLEPQDEDLLPFPELKPFPHLYIDTLELLNRELPEVLHLAANTHNPDFSLAGP